jgi:isoleucyl-tRNA synthetase
MGTALNKVLKDLIVKYKSMTGHDAPYVPGWDCHGLPIEYKVVKSDATLSPAQVRKKSEEFARKYIDIQRAQFKRLGVFGDWENPYLTLDKAYEADILRVFGDMVKQGLVYRGQKPVYWSTGCQTALAEAEVEYADKESPAIFVKFEVVDQPGTFVVIWTTTPWTLPANLAVAIHPSLTYSYYRKGSDRLILCGSLPSSAYAKLGAEKVEEGVLSVSALLKTQLRHPFLDRVVPILSGDFVTSETGTGCVHIAPGHGQDDYQLAKHLGILSPVDHAGRFTEDVGVESLRGKYVLDANRDVIEILRLKGSLIAEEKIQHSYPHCWRSKTPVIFRAVEQWFIRVEDLKAQALTAIDSVEWIPSWGKNRIRGTVESRSDWCISRQRSWGVPLPIFYKPDGEAILDFQLIQRIAEKVEREGSNFWFERNADELCQEFGLPSGSTKRNDTLDVWIDSGSSHRAVLQRHPELHFPADVYLEGSDQHRGWFQSSLLTSVAVNQGKAPYRSVITNGFLVDLDGKKISKSGTYEKPKDAEAFVSKYGADVVRLWVASENYQNDVPLSEEIFSRIGETYRSIRNSLRILHGNLFDFDPSRHRVELKMNGNSVQSCLAQLGEVAIDVWMRSRLQKLIQEVRSAYDAYEFHKVYHAINAFCAVEISAWYVDITKDRMYCDESNSRRRRATQTVMYEVASALARLFAPILSYTSEEFWGYFGGKERSIHLETMPEPDPSLRDLLLEEEFDALWSLRSKVMEELEQQRKKEGLGKGLDRRILLVLEESAYRRLKGTEAQLAELMIVSQVEIQSVDHETKVEKVVVLPPLGKKCARSWKWDESVGKDSDFPDLSLRDAQAVRIRLKDKSSPALVV